MDVQNHNKNKFAKKEKASQKSLIKNLIKLLLVLIVIYFVYLQLSRNWKEVVDYSWTINFGILILSVIMHLITFILFSYIWCILIKAFGHTVHLKHAFKIGYIANLGRYIPGKVWPVIGMSYLAKQIDINEEVSVTSWIVALIFTLPSAFMASSVCILFSPGLLSTELTSYLGSGIYLAAAAIFIISLALIIVPNQTLSLFNILLKLFGRPSISFRLSFKTAFLVYFGYFVCWICYGFAFWLFLSAITSNTELPILPSVGAFIIAYQLGYLAFFAPGGIGVRELVLTIILSPYLGGISAGIAVAARLWNMIAEIIAAIAAWFIKMPKE